MATTDYWAECPMDRTQMALFSPTLDSMIAEMDPVREFDRVLDQIDWSTWEAEYNGTVLPVVNEEKATFSRDNPLRLIRAAQRSNEVRVGEK